MKKFKAIAIIFIIAILTACGAKKSSTNVEQTFNLKLAENQPDSNPLVTSLREMAELVKEKSKGTVNIEIYSNASLGSESENIQQVQAGALDMARVNTVPLSDTVKELTPFVLPYIFDSFETKWKVLDSEIGQEILNSYDKYSLKGLGFFESGSRSFYTTGATINTPADMNGLKIRVQASPINIQMLKLLGATATPMEYGDVYQGLMTGIIDGAENDFVSYYTSGHYQVAKNYFLDMHSAPPATLIMSKKTWSKLSTAQQTAVIEAIKESSLKQRVIMNDFQDESRKKAIENGATVKDVNVKLFQEAVSSMYNDYPDALPIINKIREMSK